MIRLSELINNINFSAVCCDCNTRITGSLDQMDYHIWLEHRNSFYRSLREAWVKSKHLGYGTIDDLRYDLENDMIAIHNKNLELR